MKNVFIQALRRKKSLKLFVSLCIVTAITVPLYTNCSDYEAFQPISTLGEAARLSSRGGSSLFGGIPSYEKALSAPAMRPLSQREYNAATKTLLGDTSSPGSGFLPEDSYEPFDNLIETNGASPAKIDAYEYLAKDITSRFLNDTSRIANHLPCIPSSHTDTDCFNSIIRRLGLSFLRRPVTAAERTSFLDLINEYAASNNNYRDGLDVFLRLMLQHPDFLYRSEVGQREGAHYQLNDFELASKISFTILGHPPSLDLLEAAEQGLLSNKTSLTTLVEGMLNSDEAVDHLDFFHAAWLGYQELGRDGGIEAKMRRESREMIKRIVFEENKAWREILQLKEAYVDAELASHYGLEGSTSANPRWIPQTDRLRKGLLGTGSFLSIGRRGNIASITQRGYNIYKKLFCRTIPPPPPGIDLDNGVVDANNPNACRFQHTKAVTYTPNSSCYGCHSKIDGIGLGLANYNPFGQFMEHEENRPDCMIDGVGRVEEHSAFRGPAGLADIAYISRDMEYCLVDRWMQLTQGIKDLNDHRLITQAFFEKFKQHGNFKSFIMELVLSEQFRLRAPFTPEGLNE